LGKNDLRLVKNKADFVKSMWRLEELNAVYELVPVFVFPAFSFGNKQKNQKYKQKNGDSNNDNQLFHSSCPERKREKEKVVILKMLL
jgi:hypothetical protein